MKTLLTLAVLVLLASCGNDGGEGPNKYPIPTELQTGTWINQDSDNVTTELVFNADDTLTITTTKGSTPPTVQKNWLMRYNYNAFLVSNESGLRVWSFSYLKTNSVDFCIAGKTVGENGVCKHYTR